MIISIFNFTNGKIKDEELQCAIRAINRQIGEDFEPYWSFGAQLRLEGKAGSKPSKTDLSDMRGDAVLYLWDKTDVEDALGYHEANQRGIPYGFVFTELSKQLGESWTVTLSHEALELVGDAQANLLVQGPHPAHPDQVVFHWFEMCDAVQAESYSIDGVGVSNFVLPLYFTEDEQASGRNDFLGRSVKGKTLRSFGLNPGGYIGFFNPATNNHETFAQKGDVKAAKRLAAKRDARTGRGSLRKESMDASRVAAEKLTRVRRAA
jgi:hypothetical protein